MPAITNTGQTGPKNIPITDILAHLYAGKSHTDIAKLLNCSQANISERIKAHTQDIQDTEIYKEKRADILALFQKKLLYSVTDADIKKMSPYQRFGSFALLYDKERLERGQLTGILSLEGRLEAINAAREYTDRARLAADTSSNKGAD